MPSTVKNTPGWTTPEEQAAKDRAYEDRKEARRIIKARAAIAHAEGRP